MPIRWRGFVQRVQKHQAVTFNHGHWQREKKLGRWCVCSFHHVCDEQALLPLPSYDFATRGRHSTLENVLHQFIQISLLRESRARSDNCSVKLVVWCRMVGHVSAVIFGLQNFVVVFFTLAVSSVRQAKLLTQAFQNYLISNSFIFALLQL